MHRYVKNTFEPLVSTVGASFLTKRVLDSTSDTIVRLQIWDTAGQERFRSISRLYYRGANACLLCYDITDDQSFADMTSWYRELRSNLPDPDQLVVHVVGTKSDVVALDPGMRKVPFERTIAYVAEQLHPSRASTPPPTAGLSTATGAGPASRPGSAMDVGGPPAHLSFSTLPSADSKRSSAFWGMDVGWDCCHEISAKDGEGIEEVFRVITRKLVEQRNKRSEAELILRQRAAARENGGPVPASLAGVREAAAGGGSGSFRVGQANTRRSWLGMAPSVVVDSEEEGEGEGEGQGEGQGGRRKGRCC